MNHIERGLARHVLETLPEDPSKEERLKATKKILLAVGVRPDDVVLIEDPDAFLGFRVEFREDYLDDKLELAEADELATKTLRERGVDPAEISRLTPVEKGQIVDPNDGV